MKNEIFIHEITEIDNPKFMPKPKLATYTIGDKLGKKHYWELEEDPINTVHVIVVNTDTNKVLLVEQTRIPVFVNQGIRTTIEVCAGLCDKYSDKSPEEQSRLIAIDEVREELGYEIQDLDLGEPITFLSSVGTKGALQFCFAAKVTNDQFKGQLLQNDEDIIVKEIDLNEIDNFLTNTENTDAVTKFLMLSILLVLEAK